MKTPLIAVSVVALGVAVQDGPVEANKRLYRIAALTELDLKAVPAGPAVWFHRSGAVYLVVTGEGRAMVRFAGHLTTMSLASPKPGRIACVPMAFRANRIGGVGGKSARISKASGSWRLTIPFGTQLLKTTELSCRSGKRP